MAASHGFKSGRVGTLRSLVIFSLFLVGSCQDLEEGDPCDVGKNKGKCLPGSQCTTLAEAVRLKIITRRNIPKCGLGVYEELICCPILDRPIRTDAPLIDKLIEDIFNTNSTPATAPAEGSNPFKVKASPQTTTTPSPSPNINPNGGFFDLNEFVEGREEEPNAFDPNRFIANNMQEGRGEADQVQSLGQSLNTFGDARESSPGLNSLNPLFTTTTNTNQDLAINTPSKTNPFLNSAVQSRQQQRNENRYPEVEVDLLFFNPNQGIPLRNGRLRNAQQTANTFQLEANPFRVNANQGPQRPDRLVFPTIREQVTNQGNLQRGTNRNGLNQGPQMPAMNNPFKKLRQNDFVFPGK